MFTLDALRELLANVPFVRFRLHLSEGKSVDVRHPELVLPGRQYFVVGIPEADRAELPFDRSQMVFYMHVSRVEMLSPGPHPGSSSPPPSSPMNTPAGVS